MTMILLVDDNRQNRYMLEVLLKAQGYEVAMADHGAEALTLAVRHPPDLIITDILMPVMDGFSLCRKWKADDRLKNIPFIFYTATYTDPQDERFALSLGAERFIIKPQQPEVLVQVVRDLLKDIQKGKPVANEKPLGEEMEFFRQYNEVLFNKLEQKMIQLENSNRKLENVVAERRRAEETLRESEERFRSLSNASLEGIMIHDQGVILDANMTFARLFGYEQPEELIGKNGLELILTPEARAHISQRMRQQEKGVFEVTGIQKDGTTFLAETDSQPIKYRGHDARIVSCRDITERKKAEEALKQEIVFSNAIIDSLPGVFYLCDDQGKLIRWNDNEKETTGYSMVELSQMNILQLFPETQRGLVASRIQEAMETGHAFVEASIATKSGSLIPFYFTGFRMIRNGKRYIVGVGINASEKNKLEDQLRQAQKMEAIGTLAGGIAHDFNNILTAIIGYGNIALMKMAKDDPQRLNIEYMLDAGERAAHLTKDLLLFSRRQTSERKPIDLNDVIRKVGMFLKRVIGEDIEFKTTQFEEPLPILGDAHQLEQVLMNLATNARDAMPKGGIFSVTTEKMKFDNEFVSIDGYGKSGNYALITISDTGKGMDDVTREHIFEPFFTTKEVGKGTGLGLSVVYGIIKQHDGLINVYSEPGRGTIFQIYLPLIAVHVDETKFAMEEHPIGGTETILLAEDDEIVRNMIKTMLENFGYQVIIANDGQDAVNKYIENKDKIRLLLLDIIMPKKTGKVAYDEIMAMKPGVKVLFVSGYAPDEVGQRVLTDVGMPVITKPIAPKELLKKVRETLDR